jgi:hypothetical protein
MTDLKDQTIIDLAGVLRRIAGSSVCQSAHYIWITQVLFEHAAIIEESRNKVNQ